MSFEWGVLYCIFYASCVQSGYSLIVFQHFIYLLLTDTNDLKGTIPRVIGDLDKLKFLLLNRNQLTGSIPNSFEKMTNLGEFVWFGR